MKPLKAHGPNTVSSIGSPLLVALCGPWVLVTCLIIMVGRVLCALHWLGWEFFHPVIGFVLGQGRSR